MAQSSELVKRTTEEVDETIDVSDFDLLDGGDASAESLALATQLMANSARGDVHKQARTAAKVIAAEGVSFFGVMGKPQRDAKWTAKMFTVRRNVLVVSLPATGDDLVGRTDGGDGVVLRVLRRMTKAERDAAADKRMPVIDGASVEVRQFDSAWVAINTGVSDTYPDIPRNRVIKFSGVRAVRDPFIHADGSQRTELCAEAMEITSLDTVTMFYNMRAMGLYRAMLPRDAWTPRYSPPGAGDEFGQVHLVRINPSTKLARTLKVTHPASRFGATHNSVQELSVGACSWLNPTKNNKDVSEVRCRLVITNTHTALGTSYNDAVAAPGPRSYTCALWTLTLYADDIFGLGVRTPAVFAEVAPWMMHGLDAIAAVRINDYQTTCAAANQPEFNTVNIDYGIVFGSAIALFTDMGQLARITGIEVFADFVQQPECSRRYGSVTCAPAQALHIDLEGTLCLTDALSHDGARDKVASPSYDFFVVPVIEFDKTEFTFIEIIGAMRALPKSTLYRMLLRGAISLVSEIDPALLPALGSVNAGRFHVFAVPKNSVAPRTKPAWFSRAIEARPDPSLPVIAKYAPPPQPPLAIGAPAPAMLANYDHASSYSDDGNTSPIVM